MSFFPPFSFERIFVEPWATDFEGYGLIVLMAFLVSLACGLVGNFVVVRRMALVGDAISHSLLPGIVLAFLLTSSLAAPVMLVGAVIAGILTTMMIELIHKKSRVKTDAALGIVFSLFFAIGVIMINLFVGQIHFDAECVLYGEIAFVPFAPPVVLAGMELGPQPIVVMALVTLVVIALILLFYKELLVTSFDAGLARSLGIPVNVFHYGLMALLSVVIVSAFESVGVILVIAMLIFPAVTAAMISDCLSTLLWLTVPCALIYAFGGLHLALALECSIAGAMVVVAGALFALVWLFSPQRGLLPKAFKRNRTVSPPV